MAMLDTSPPPPSVSKPLGFRDVDDHATVLRGGVPLSRARRVVGGVHRGAVAHVGRVFSDVGVQPWVSERLYRPVAMEFICSEDGVDATYIPDFMLKLWCLVSKKDDARLS